MKSLHRIFFVVLFSVPLTTVFGQQSGALQGAWELQSQQIDGKDQPLTARHIKLLTKNHSDTMCITETGRRLKTFF